MANTRLRRRSVFSIPLSPAPRSFWASAIFTPRARPTPTFSGNRVSNFWLSFFTGLHLIDTQCGLRRYPLPETLALGMKDEGFGFEAEVILRAARSDLPIVEIPFRVFYPEQRKYRTHFRAVVDPARIVVRVVSTVLGA